MLFSSFFKILINLFIFGRAETSLLQEGFL